jgi:hypothetical protein
MRRLLVNIGTAVADFHINVLPALTNLFNKPYRPYRAPLNESGLNLPHCSI